jgi:hypothetical protein
LKTRAWICLPLFVASCTCGVNLDPLKFACAQDSECGPDMVCVGSECVDPGAGGGAGGGTAGSGGGGGSAAGGGGGSGGGSGCFVDGGTAQAIETLCSDGKDNDCDLLADCADPQCGARACGAGGRVCLGATCTCTVDGGSVEPFESSCSDGKDNDCDGLVDCVDPNCNGLSCGLPGRTCVAMACACSGNGGTPQPFESLCSDARDNDCDGLIDCADPTCEGRACGAGCSCIGALKAELACSGGVDDDGDGQTDCADTDCAGRSCGQGCVCSGGLKVETLCANATDDDGNGQTDCADSNCCVGCPLACELICNNGLDEDGNQLIDCADPKCGGQSCGSNGRVCNATSCVCSGNGGVPQASETSCFDGVDNDCDGLVDCADPGCQAQPCTCELNCKDGIDNDCNGSTDCADSKCLRKSCSATSAASVCCSTASSAVACKNLGTDELNCGGCGLACASNRLCVATTSGGVPSGRCDCSNSMMCPSSQTCSNVCQCSSAASCATGQACISQVCSYP